MQKLLSLAAALFIVPAAADPYDLVVYGGTGGGLASAVAAAQEGVRVVVLEPTDHVGGMLTGGLGWTDIGVETAIGGFSRRFYERVYEHYQQPAAWHWQDRREYLDAMDRLPGPRRRVNHQDRVWWAVEPCVAAAVLQRMADEAGVRILTSRRLESVHKQGRRLVTLACANGETYAGRVFIDATYEGDLMAAAGVPYRVGRESRAEHGEPLAGVVPAAGSTRKQWDVDIRPFDAAGKLLFGVQDVPRGADGAGDRKVQAYNIRLCLTDHPANRAPIEKPTRYDPARYELLARYIAAKGDSINLTGPKGRSLLLVDPLPNRKTDVNDGAPFSTDFIGANWDYPDGDAATRRRILADHVDYTRGLLYFLGHDPRVPERIRRQMLEWGLPKDEFVAHGHWTPQVYIREARRMVGGFVVTQHDIQTRREKPDSVGMGSYNADSHHVQRIVDAAGFVRNEGNPNDLAIGHEPYEIPYRCLTPRRADCENLLVTFCVSATHMGFASLRMEPVFMILGESAGVAAALAARDTAAVQDVAIEPLQRRLVARGQRLRIADAATGEPR